MGRKCRIWNDQVCVYDHHSRRKYSAETCLHCILARKTLWEFNQQLTAVSIIQESLDKQKETTTSDDTGGIKPDRLYQ